MPDLLFVFAEDGYVRSGENENTLWNPFFANQRLELREVHRKPESLSTELLGKDRQDLDRLFIMHIGWQVCGHYLCKSKGNELTRAQNGGH